MVNIPTRMEAKNYSLFYGAFKALNDINIKIPSNKITAFIGPSGCGKSTLLKSFNRMNELVPTVRTEGSVFLDGKDVSEEDVVELRKKVGMVFQSPNPFPKTIFDNVAYGPRLHGTKNRSRLAEIVEKSLKKASLWDEVKHDLNKQALALSGGQQQRLCIARAIAIEPEVILMDEPTSALDPVATLRIEELMNDLKRNYTIAIVTHNMQQAARVSDFTGFMLTDEKRAGNLIEFGETKQIFTTPSDSRTEDYISGRFG